MFGFQQLEGNRYYLTDCDQFYFLGHLRLQSIGEKMKVILKLFIAPSQISVQDAYSQDQQVSVCPQRNEG